MQLFKFEMKKNWRRKKFLILFLFLLVCIAALFYRNILMQEKVIEQTLVDLYPHFREANNILSDLKMRFRENPGDSSLLELQENAFEMQQAIGEWQIIIRNGDWDHYPSAEAEYLKSVQTHRQLGGDYAAFQEDELELAQEKNAILLEHGMAYSDEAYPVTMANFVHSAAVPFGALIGVIMLIVVMGDLLSDEYERKTIGTLQTQPIKRWRILWSKYASIMTVALWMLVAFFFISLCIPWLFGEGMGSFHFPQLVEHGDTFIYISTGEYLWKVSVLFIATASFASSLLLLCSIVFRNQFGTILAVIFAMSGGIFMTNNIEALQTVFNPFYYFRYMDLIERPVPSFSWAYVLLLFVYSLAFLGFGYFLQKKAHFLQRETSDKKPFHKGRTLGSRNRFWALFLFEVRKVRRQNLIKYNVICLSIFVIGFYLYLTYEKHQREHAFFEQMETDVQLIAQTNQLLFEKKIQENQAIIKHLEGQESELSEEEKMELQIVKDQAELYQKEKEKLNTTVNKAKLVVDSYKSGNYTSFYQYWIYENRWQKGEIIEPDGTTFVDLRPTEQGGLSNFTYHASIAEKELLDKKQIEPVFAVEFLNTIYDRYPNPLDDLEWKNKTRKAENTSLFYLYSFFQSSFYLLPLGLLLFLFGAGFTVEKGKRQTLSFLKTQPLSQSGLLISKYSSSAAMTLGISAALIVIMIIIGLIGNRFGDWDFPVLHYDVKALTDAETYTGYMAVEGGFHFMDMGDYLVETTLLFFMALLFLLTLSIVFSLLFNHAMLAVAASLIASIGGYIVSTMPQLAAWVHLSPFTYLNISTIGNGETATLLNNPSIQTETGVAALNISTIIVLSLCFIVLKRK